jgi:hypothetical protein
MGDEVVDSCVLLVDASFAIAVNSTLLYVGHQENTNDGQNPSSRVLVVLRGFVRR